MDKSNTFCFSRSVAELKEAGPQRRPGGRAARVKEVVHRAVLDVVTERGVENVGIPEISRRAGVRDSSIYRRWGTRENLILDVLLAASERTMPSPDTGALLGDLTALAIALIDYLGSPLGRDLARTLAAAADSEDIDRARQAFWDERYRAAEPMVERAIARGELPPSANARTTVELLVGPIHFRNLLTREQLDAGYAGRLAGYVVRALQPGAESHA